MHENESGRGEPGDEGTGHDRLSRPRRRDEHAKVVLGHLRDGVLLS